MKSWLLDDERAGAFLEIHSEAKLVAWTNYSTSVGPTISASSAGLLEERLDIEMDHHEHESIMHWKTQMQSIGRACKFVRAEFVEHSPAIRGGKNTCWI
eukprot:1749289-Amphidinium_carterae.2